MINALFVRSTVCCLIKKEPVPKDLAVNALTNTWKNTCHVRLDPSVSAGGYSDEAWCG